MKTAKYFAGVLLAFGLFLNTAVAADFVVPPQEGDGSVTISGLPRKNLYTAGAEVTVSAPVTGDLYAAGGNLVVNNDVEQDLNVAGGDVTLNGKVGGDVRVAGGKLMINGAIGGDLILAGGQVTLAGTSSVGGDLIAAGGRVKIEAPVTGSARLVGGQIIINSRINGPVWAQIDEFLHFGPNAVVTEKVSYKAPKEAQVQDGAQVTTLDFQKIERKPMNSAKAFLGGALLIKILAWFVAAWLLIRFLPNRTRAIVEGAGTNPWLNVGWGFIGLIIIPVAVIALLFTLVGYYVAFVVLAWYMVALSLTCLFSALLVGAYLDKWLMKRTELHLDWQVAIIGAVVLTLLSFVPVFGWIIKGLLFLMTFGSLLHYVKNDLVTHK